MIYNRWRLAGVLLLIQLIIIVYVTIGKSTHHKRVIQTRKGINRAETDTASETEGNKHDSGVILPRHKQNNAQISDSSSALEDFWRNDNVQRDENVQRKRDENVQLQRDENVQQVDTRWRRRLLFIWCGKRPFYFSNYLSIKSAVRSIYPSSVMFAYDRYPTVINEGYPVMYDRWILELEDRVPFLTKQTITPDDNLCNTTNRTTMDIERFLAKHDFLGCLYIADLTVLVEPFVLEDVRTKVDYYNVNSRQGFLFVPETKENSKTGRCSLVEAYSDTVPEICFVLDKPVSAKKQLDPEHFMYNPSPLASQLRLVYYGSREFREQKPDSTNPAPNIAHYVWLGGGKMNYCFFLSVLSTVYVGRVDIVYIHGDSPPTGKYWEQLIQMEISNQIQVVPWHSPMAIFGSPVKFVANQADVVKSSVMWSMGGIIMDPDILFVRAPDPEMFHYEAYIMAGGHPHMLNPASAISKPRSEYARLWMESEKNFRYDLYVWNCCYNTYKTWERNPRIAKVVRDFTLVCWGIGCFGMWKDKDAIHKNVTITSSDDWRNIVVNVHFPKPDPFASYEQSIKLPGIAGEVCRLILRKAGLLGPI